MIMYLIALTVAVSLGYLLLRFITKGRLNFILSLFLGAALGLGLVGQIIFYLQLLGNNFNPFLPPVVSLITLAVLFWMNKRIKSSFDTQPLFPLVALTLLLIPLWLEANFFPLGGWDAWSCWNLKAKFIYLGQDNWKDMFAPTLWRSNTHYPLALPTINVWFWQWTGLSQDVAMYNSIIITFLTAAILMFGLKELKAPLWICVVITLAVFTLAHGNTLSISQYSDILFSLDLLCVFVCYLLFKQTKDYQLLIITGIFIGLLSFTKNEGLVASAILTLLIAMERIPKIGKAFLSLSLAALPTIIFILIMAPRNEAFVNGLNSAIKPSTWERLAYILAYTGMEFVSLKWNGLWILAAIGLGLNAIKAFKKPLVIIGLFSALYLAVVIAYYQVNTFFEIGWWMQSTLNRIIFVLMPSVFLWLGLSL